MSLPIVGFVIGVSELTLLEKFLGMVKTASGSSFSASSKTDTDMEKLLSAIMDAIPVPLFYQDSNGQFLGCTKSFARLVGEKTEDIVGRTLYDFVPKTFADAQAELDRRIAIDHTMHIFEAHVTTRGGQNHDVIVYKSPLFDEDGRFIGIVGAMVDITERKHTEEVLKAITSAARDAIIMIDNDGNITFWNEAAERIFGYSQNEVLGKNCHDLLAPERLRHLHHKAFPHFQMAGDGDAIGKTLELPAVRRDGTEFPIELSLSAVNFEGKWHAVGIVRDITERKQH